MPDIRILIADDDDGMRLIMRKLIERSEGFELVGEAHDGEELLTLYERLDPQVVLMDVEMPKKTGVECARLIQDKNPKTVLIFATAHEEYMGDAFSVYAFDYLLKPFKAERVLNTLRLVRERLTADTKTASPLPLRPRTSAKKLILKHKDGMSFVDVEDILLIQREDRATVLYTKDNERFVTSETLGELEERLPEDLFFRSHKSYIINLAHIASVTPYGRWTYVIQLEGTEHDALITGDKFELLQTMFA